MGGGRRGRSNSGIGLQCKGFFWGENTMELVHIDISTIQREQEGRKKIKYAGEYPKHDHIKALGQL